MSKYSMQLNKQKISYISSQTPIQIIVLCVKSMPKSGWWQKNVEWIPNIERLINRYFILEANTNIDYVTSQCCPKQENRKCQWWRKPVNKVVWDVIDLLGNNMYSKSPQVTGCERVISSQQFVMSPLMTLFLPFVQNTLTRGRWREDGLLLLLYWFFR